MIQGIEVENYKVLDSIKVEGFSKINFFVGKNDCGKTSLLEAIHIASDPNYIDNIFFITNVIRGLNIDITTLNTFFFNLDTDKKISIKSTTNNQKSSLEITPRTYTILQNNMLSLNMDSQKNTISDNEKILNMNINSNMNFRNNAIINNENKIIAGLNVNINNVEYKDFIYFEIKSNGQIETNSMLPKPPTTIMYPSHSSMIDMTQDVANLRKKNRENELLEYIQIFNDDVIDIETMLNSNMNSIFLKIKNMPERVHLKLMGEGFRKYLNIIVGLIANKHKYILIDEIENGLHFETMRKLINSIIKLSKTNDIQFFITTHSYEFLETLSEVAQEKDYKDVAIFNLNKSKQGKLQAIKYDIDGLNILFDNNLEIRE